MKVAVFKHNSGRRIGIAPNDSSDEFIETAVASQRLNLRNFDLPGDMVSLLWSSLEPYGPYTQLRQAIDRNDPALGEAMVDIKDVKLEAPIARPGKIICLAGNYRAHIVESGYIARSSP